MRDNGPFVFAAFTRAGAELAVRLSREFHNTVTDDPVSAEISEIGAASCRVSVRVFVPERCLASLNPEANAEAMNGGVREWAGEWFTKASAIIFVCACGIAVRAIAPWLRSKTEDPAVIILDERGRFVIPILSGHIGGANDLARYIASFTGGTALVTTATDVNNLIAVDEWAVTHDCEIENPQAIRDVSSAVLEHRPVGVAITHELQATPWPVTLWLRPRVLTLGVGCVRGADPDAVQSAALDFLDDAGVSPLSLQAITSIDLKADEPALIALAEHFKVPFVTFSAQELAKVPGCFTVTERSEHVRAVTGVDNVCERAAVLFATHAAQSSGRAVLLRSKTIYPGMTFALAKARKTQEAS